MSGVLEIVLTADALHDLVAAGLRRSHNITGKISRINIASDEGQPVSATVKIEPARSLIDGPRPKKRASSYDEDEEL